MCSRTDDPTQHDVPDDAPSTDTPDYREGFGLGVEHAYRNFATVLPEERSRSYYRGYEEGQASVHAEQRRVEAHRAYMHSLNVAAAIEQGADPFRICRECGSDLPEDEPVAEVYLNASRMKAQAGGQSVLVDEIPDDQFGPFLVHQEPCYTANREKYDLA